MSGPQPAGGRAATQAAGGDAPLPTGGEAPLVGGGEAPPAGGGEAPLAGGGEAAPRLAGEAALVGGGEAAPQPAGSYAVARRVGGLVHTAGMTPRRGGALVATGMLGSTISVETGRELTTLATRRALDAAASILQPGESLAGVVSLTVFLAATPEFTEHSAVADAASAVVAEWMPAAPLPVRAAVGVASLPGGSPVEVQLTAETHPAMTSAARGR